MGSGVSLAVFICNSQIGWQSISVIYVQVTNNRYDYYGLRPGDSDYKKIGYVVFTAQTPPGCPNASQNCNQGFTEEMPDIIFEQKDPSFTYKDECSNVKTLAFFSPGIRSSESSNLYNFTNDNIDVCFNLQTQEWNFEILQDIELNFVRGICTDNIQNEFNAQIIYSLSEITQLNCSKLRSSIISHKTYPFGSGIYDGYVFSEIVDSHELQHQYDWQDYVNNHLNNYHNIPNKISNSCQDFANDNEAKEQIIGAIKELFLKDFWNPYKEEYLLKQYLFPTDEKTKGKHKRLEQQLHERPNVKEIIKRYEDEIKKHCS